MWQERPFLREGRPFSLLDDAASDAGAGFAGWVGGVVIGLLMND